MDNEEIMIYLLDLLGTLAFAVGGAYKAKTRKLNIFGVMLLGAITAIGGGTVRDLILGRTPLFYLQDPNYLLIALIASAATYFLPDFFKRTYSIFRFTDSVGLATFAIIGVSAAYNHLYPAGSSLTLMMVLACTLLGTLTAVGGGIIRDVILGDVPYALKAGSNYVSSGFAGSIIFLMLLSLNENIAIVFSVFVTILLREIISPYGLYHKIKENGFSNHQKRRS